MCLMVLISDSGNEVNVGDFYKNYLNYDSDCVTFNVQGFILEIRKFARGQKNNFAGQVQSPEWNKTCLWNCGSHLCCVLSKNLLNPQFQT